MEATASVVGAFSGSIPTHDEYLEAQGGIPLRDKLAMAAMPGIAFDCGLSADEAADKAYEFADAMLRARKRRR